MQDETVHLIRNDDVAEHNEQSGDGKTTFCDRKGNVYQFDLVAQGEAARAKAIADGGEVIASFQNMRALVSFGMRTYEGNNFSGFSVNQQMYDKQFTALEREAVAHAFLRVAGAPLPPFSPLEHAREVSRLKH